MKASQKASIAGSAKAVLGKHLVPLWVPLPLYWGFYSGKELVISQHFPISWMGFKSSAEKQMHRGQIKKQEEQVREPSRSYEVEQCLICCNIALCCLPRH